MRKNKEQKIVKNGEIIRVRRGLPRTNLPVKLPENPTWLKQSNIITLMSYDFKTLQLRVLISLIEKIQGGIEESIKNKTAVEQLTLFKQYENESRILLSIKYKDLGITPNQYPDVRAALRQLATIPIELDTKDPITGADSWSVTGLFKAYIPRKTHNKVFTIEIEKEIAKNFFNVDKGFTKFIKEIAFASQSKYTVRMYMLISSWKDKGGFSIRMDKFRKWLKLEKKYLNYKDLYKRIIRPVYEELFEKANCWFEVSEVYKEGESQPYKLNFKVIRSSLSKKEKERLETQIQNIKNLAFRYLKMEDKHIKQIEPFINITNSNTVLNKVIELHNYVQNNYKKINSIPDYCTKSLLAIVKELPDEV